MPLEREVDYWEGIASRCVDGAAVRDNVWKRPEQLARLLRYEWMEQNVLEIGVGNAMVAGALQVVVQGHWKYIGTELSSRFREHAKQSFGLTTLQADVRELPDGPFTRIIAFDSLEHVRPEHRELGYRRIFEVAAKDALLFIHFSRSTSYHDKEFDHPFGLDDLSMLEKAGFTLNNLERYSCFNGMMKGYLDYTFAVMQK